MAKDIAVFVGEQNTTVSVYDPGKIVVYRKSQGKWDILREKTFIIDKSKGLKDLRLKMEELIEFLADCKTFAAHSVIGVPYYELEKAERNVWEFEGKPEEFLDHILEKEEEALADLLSAQNNKAPVAPVKTSDGCYFLSLKDIQTGDSGITSKQALQPFLRQGKFYSLEVLCSHIPPWLEAELLSGNLLCASEQVGKDEVRLVITKKCCHEC